MTSDKYNMASVFEIQRTATSCILLCILVSLLVRESNSMPRPPWLSPTSKLFKESAECHTDDELLDLCQRCAKLTKSKLAYPACCSTDLEARRWCSDFVYFGRGEYDYD